MVVDGAPANRSRWQALGGKLWMGDISSRVQDVKVTGIPLENAAAAIRMVRARPKRAVSAEEAARLAALLRKNRRTPAGTHSPALESNEQPGG